MAYMCPALPRWCICWGGGWDGKRIFLQDGDALVYPFPDTVKLLEHINEIFPQLERISAYATAQDILRRSQEELAELKQLKLDIFYIGVESGDEEVLRKIHKGVNYAEMVTACRKAKDAGIALSVSVILGLGGVDGSHQHALETARILTDIDPEFAGALTLTFVPGTPLYGEAEQGTFHSISPLQSLEELKIMIENASFTDCFFSSMHASNYFSVRGRLPQDREQMLEQLRYILTKRDPALLRPEFLRGL
ncbi:radical SAM protein [Chloroflexota bacterium]